MTQIMNQIKKSKNEKEPIHIDVLEIKQTP